MLARTPHQPHTDLSRILLIDDDAALLDALSIAFEDAGHDVLTARDGVHGLEAVRASSPDAVVSDVNMPGLDGFALCKRLREGGSRVPIILLTSRDNEIDEALGLELGADDYVAKPFSTRVLLARVAALLRRETMRAQPSTERAVVKGKLELFPERIEVRYAGAPITVTVTEFRMLEALATRAGMVLSRDRLLEIVRGDDSVVAERIIDTYVRRLRRKLEAVDASFDRIETVIGAGYRWKSE
jgi:DNA-binding response OmpR family regulator